jgi:hypothetical protein
MSLLSPQNPMSFLQTAEAWQSDNPNETMITLQSMDGSYLIVGVAYSTCFDLGKENLQKFRWVEEEDGFMIVLKEAKSEDEKEKGRKEGEEEKEQDTKCVGQQQVEMEGETKKTNKRLDREGDGGNGEGEPTSEDKKIAPPTKKIKKSVVVKVAFQQCECTRSPKDPVVTVKVEGTRKLENQVLCKDCGYCPCITKIESSLILFAGGHTNKEKRFEAYGNFAKVLKLKRTRQKLPICVTEEVKKVWPDEEGNYVGFKE